MRGRSVVGLASAMLATALFGPLAARATPSQEQDFVARINAERTSRGMQAVVSQTDLTSVARAWSSEMAQAGSISHDPNITNEVRGWTILGDTVGMGHDVAAIHEAFMNSDIHRAVILRPDYNQVGVGIVNAGDEIWVTEIFALRTSVASAPPPVPKPKAAAAPHPGPFVAATTPLLSDVAPTARSMTVDILLELISLDAPVDPATGLIR